MMKKKIYIDIDGVLLDYKTGKPAEYAEELIMFLTSGRYDCYWLTTHCKGDAQTALDYLSEHFSEKTMRRLRRIQPTQWTDLKTEAIDITSDFIWLEDHPFQAEISALDALHKRASLCMVDLNREHELLNVINFIKGHGKERCIDVCRRRRRRPGKVIAALIACIVLFFLVRPLIWRIITRPTDQISTYTEYAERGDIFDCRDNLIATNKTAYDIHMDCCVVKDQKVWEDKSRRLAQSLALVLPEKSAPEWWDYLQNARKKNKRYLPIAKNVDLAMVETLRRLPLFNEGNYKGGFIRTAKTVREYPYGNLARRTIGEWRNTDNSHMFGIEGQFNADLDGTDGTRKVKSGFRGRKVRRWEIEKKDKIDGWDVYTTIYMKHQALADSLLRAAVESDEDIAGGCLALMEVKTGVKSKFSTNNFKKIRIPQFSETRFGSFVGLFLVYKQ